MANNITTTAMTAVLRDTLPTLLPEFMPLAQYQTDFSSEVMAKGMAAISVNSFGAFTGAEYTAASTSYATEDIVSSARTITPTILYSEVAWNELNEAGTPIDMATKLLPNLVSAVASQCWAKITALVTAANYATTPMLSAANAFDADDVAALAATLDDNKVSRNGRSLVIKPQYNRYLTADNSIQASYAYGSAEAIRTGRVPVVHGLNVLPITGTIPPNAQALEGWAAGKEAFVMAARLPNFEAQLAQGAAVANEVEPSTGLPLQVRYWFDIDNGLHKLWVGTRFGAAVGHGAALVRIASA